MTPKEMSKIAKLVGKPTMALIYFNDYKKSLEKGKLVGTIPDLVDELLDVGQDDLFFKIVEKIMGVI